MKYDHVEDRAALYALGALPDSERAEIDAHLAECAACLRAIGRAENDVALLVATEPQHAAPPALEARIDRLLQTRPVTALPIRRQVTWAYPAAIAAALLLGLMPSMYFWSANRSMHAMILAENGAMSRLASDTHRTAHFRPMDSNAPADVMYAPDGSWYVVVVRGASKALSVAWMHDGQRTMLGKAIPKGDVAMLYLPKSHRMDHLALMDGDRVVAEASLSWQT